MLFIQRKGLGSKERYVSYFTVVFFPLWYLPNSDPPDDSYSYENFLSFYIYKSQTVENVRNIGVRISLTALRMTYFTLCITLTIHRNTVFHYSNLTEIYFKNWVRTPSPTFVSLLECSICDWKKLQFYHLQSYLHVPEIRFVDAWIIIYSIIICLH